MGLSDRAWRAESGAANSAGSRPGGASTATTRFVARVERAGVTEATYPRALAHVGVTVPDASEAVEWYTDVLGLQHVMGPMTVEYGEDHIGKCCTDVLAAGSSPISSG